MSKEPKKIAECVECGSAAVSTADAGGGFGVRSHCLSCGKVWTTKTPSPSPDPKREE